MRALNVLLLAGALACGVLGQPPPAGQDAPGSLSALFAQGPPPGTGGQAPEEMALLRKMMAAELKLTYSGTRVVIDNIENRDKREREIVLRSGLRTRVTYPVDSPRHGEVVVEREGRRWHWRPQQNVIIEGPAGREKRLREHLPRTLQMIRDGELVLRRGPAQRVAGRDCNVLQINRKDGGTVMRMMIDKEKCVLLKQEILDPVNARRVIGGFYYTDVDLSARATDEDFVIRRPGARVIHDEWSPLPELQPRLDFHILVPQRLPPGYKEVGAKLIDRPGIRGVQVLYDRAGMEPVSIFEFRGRLPRERLRELRPEGFNSATRQVGEVLAVVVGKLPQEQLRAFADSLR
jgi:hypothetical protein